MSSEEGWSAANPDKDESAEAFSDRLKDALKYRAARESVAKQAKDIDEEFKLLDQLGLM